MKPRIFIGSSVEGLPIAKAIQTNLQHYAFVEIWSQTNFELSTTTLNSLIESAKSSDFAIFVFTPDDTLNIRDNSVKAIRDNVLFELGLFIGSLSIDSVYFIKPRGNDLHLPTDLIGLTPGEYDPQHPNIDAAVGPFCTKVERLIKQRYDYAFVPRTRYGLNLLSESTENIEEGKDYCIAINIPKGSKFLLKIKQPNYLANNDDRRNLIAYSFGEDLGFRILERDLNGTILSIDLETEVGEYGVKVYPGSYIIFEGFLNGNKILDKQYGQLST